MWRVAFPGNGVSSGLIGESVRCDRSPQESSSSNTGSKMIGPLLNDVLEQEKLNNDPG